MINRKYRPQAFFRFLGLLSVVFSLLFGLSGCASFKKKFIRKPKQIEKPTPVMRTRDYTREYSNVVLYQKHYLFWKYWQEELINSLGSNRKKELRAARSALDELKTLSKYLNRQGKENLTPYIVKLENITGRILSRRPISSGVSGFKRELEQHKRTIQRRFFYKDVEEWIKK